MDSIGPGEILLILVAVALLFGAKRLPELARSLGRAKTEFRRGLEEGERSASAKPEEGQVDTTRLTTGPDA